MTKKQEYAALTLWIIVPTLLQGAFILMKLKRYTNWSWWLVMSPLWIVLLLIVVLIILAVALAPKGSVKGLESE